MGGMCALGPLLRESTRAWFGLNLCGWTGNGKALRVSGGAPTWSSVLSLFINSRLNYSANSQFYGFCKVALSYLLVILSVSLDTSRSVYNLISYQEYKRCCHIRTCNYKTIQFVHILLFAKTSRSSLFSPSPQIFLRPVPLSLCLFSLLAFSLSLAISCGSLLSHLACLSNYTHPQAHTCTPMQT